MKSKLSKLSIAALTAATMAFPAAVHLSFLYKTLAEKSK